MFTLRASVKDGAKSQTVSSAAELDELIATAEGYAKAAGFLGGMKLCAPSGDELLLLVGGDETVLGFTGGNGEPPYFASLGSADTDTPLLTAYIGFAHHTEFSRRHVVPMMLGRSAALEFLQSGVRPTTVRWVET